MSKSFKGHFDLLLQRFKDNKYYFFVRASDGEMIILQNRSLELSERGTLIDNIIAGPPYAYDDFKQFDPTVHQVFRDKLLESFKLHAPGYFVGTSCVCCVGRANAKWMKELRGPDADEDIHFCWANQFLNSNYPRFIDEFLPELKKRKLVIICNEKADLSKSDLTFVKEFRIGRNAMINQMNLHEEISEWMVANDIHDHVILSSASSLSNITAYELFKNHKDNFFIDIGTTLSPSMGLGCPRTYLKNYWIDKEITGDLAKTCVW